MPREKSRGRKLDRLECPRVSRPRNSDRILRHRSVTLVDESPMHSDQSVIPVEKQVVPPNPGREIRNPGWTTPARQLHDDAVIDSSGMPPLVPESKPILIELVCARLWP